MRLELVLLFLLAGGGSASKAQSLKGQWTGGPAGNLTDNKEKAVMNIASEDSLFGGVLHWYDPETQTVRHYLIGGLYHARDSILMIFQEGATINRAGYPSPFSDEARGNVPAAATTGASNPYDTPAGKGIFIFHYKRVGHNEVLDGQWWKADPGGNLSQSVAIRLEKKAPPFIPVAPLPRKKMDTVQQHQYTALLGRETPVVATIPVRIMDSVRVDLYDNGEIDGDSVSLYLNNDLILAHLKLQATPKTIWITIDRNLPVNKLVLFAENLGRMPPNTALMEVTIKGKLYNVFLSTDYHHNAMVAFPLTD
ncbi:MAG: hypothetical protein Q8943_00285 [Bacteroidota bacterium]|nr:hypothetical protein [Bacteroidota bacterium]